MNISRRQCMKQTALGCAVSTFGWSSLLSNASSPVTPRYEQPLFHLPKTISSPVVIQSVELLKKDSVYLVRTRSKDGAVGIIRTKQIRHYIPIFKELVAPWFIGRDARDLESLVDEVYVKNYKLAGQPFWCPVAYIEQSCFDLLGKTVGNSVFNLMGGARRMEIPVYLSGSARNLSAEEEVDIYTQGVAETGAKAVKFKIGGRMSRNRDATPGRTDRLIHLAREKLGPDIILYADANGSYNASKGIEIGRQLEELDYRFFEEPCPWEELSETQRVTEALNMPVAAGEMDASLWRFQWMMDNNIMDIVQPDLNYHGGFIRTARVARMAKKRGMHIVPHNTQSDAGATHMLHFAASTPNIGAFMEFPWRKPQKEPSWYFPHFKIVHGKIKVPEGPGLGVTFDENFIHQCEVVCRIDSPK